MGDSESADGVAPVDEATLMALAHHGLTGARLWLARDDEDDVEPGRDVGFALLRGSSLDLVVAPRSRFRTDQPLARAWRSSGSSCA